VIRRVIAIFVLVAAAAGVASWSADGAGRKLTQTLVFDSEVTGDFVDKPPSGPSPGDIERSTEKFRDSTGRFVGTANTTCVFTKQIPDDMLEKCSVTAKTSEGTVTLSGVGHLNSMNPPWDVTGRSGAYKGVHGKVVYATDIALDPNVPVAPGRAFSVVVIKAAVSRPLKVGVVPRPARNDKFVRRADAACRATERKAQALPPFPFSDFDPFHPDPQELPKVGQFFNDPARRDLPSGLLEKLERLGAPSASRGAWKNVLGARRTMLASEKKQTKAALANDAPTFVKSVYQQSRDYNKLVFRSAVFGVQECTFG
jgi:allene oxide cyclase-like protein